MVETHLLAAEELEQVVILMGDTRANIAGLSNLPALSAICRDASSWKGLYVIVASEKGNPSDM